MKLLPSWHLTEEDRAAWFEWQVSPRRDWLLWGALERLSFPADRRDAEVMLQLVSFDHWERDYTEDRLRRAPTALRLVRHQL